MINDNEHDIIIIIIIVMIIIIISFISIIGFYAGHSAPVPAPPLDPAAGPSSSAASEQSLAGLRPSGAGVCVCIY